MLPCSLLIYREGEKLIYSFPDQSYQDGNDGQYKQNVDQTTNAIGKYTDQPSNDQNNGNEIKKTSHSIIVLPNNKNPVPQKTKLGS